MRIRDRLLNGPLGFGAAPLGDMFRNIPAQEAAATIDAAWQQGIYSDRAAFHDAGLSEIPLQDQPADFAALQVFVALGIFEFGRPNRIVYDYSEDGALNSIEDSLKRLAVDRLNFVWIHDLAQDFHGDAWLAQFETARTGAFRALSRLLDQQRAGAWA